MGKLLNGQDFGISNDVHLCPSCKEQWPECAPKQIVYGTGVGKNNVCCCSCYKPNGKVD